MRIIDHRVSDVGILYLVGTVDADSATAVGDAVMQLVADGGRAVILNFAKTTQIDLPGWSALLAALLLAKRSGLRLAVCGLPTVQIPTMLLVKLVCVVDTFSSLPEALDKCLEDVRATMPDQRQPKAA